MREQSLARFQELSNFLVFHSFVSYLSSVLVLTIRARSSPMNPESRWSVIFACYCFPFSMFVFVILTNVVLLDFYLSPTRWEALGDDKSVEMDLFVFSFTMFYDTKDLKKVSQRKVDISMQDIYRSSLFGGAFLIWGTVSTHRRLIRRLIKRPKLCALQR